MYANLKKYIFFHCLPLLLPIILVRIDYSLEVNPLFYSNCTRLITNTKWCFQNRIDVLFSKLFTIIIWISFPSDESILCSIIVVNILLLPIERLSIVLKCFEKVTDVFSTFSKGIAFSTDNWTHIAVNRQKLFSHTDQKVEYYFFPAHPFN